MTARWKRTGALLLTAMTLAGGLALGGTRPAAAGISVPVLYDRGPNLTWVGDDGAQYVVTSIMTSIDPPEGAFDLVIGRVAPDGTPDAAWGSYSGGYYGGTTVGVRKLDLAPPAADLARTAMAVDEDGVLTVTWVPSTCQTWAGPCDTWFSRHDATGAQVATPVLVEGNDDLPGSSLVDGSLLTNGPGGTPGWRSPTGADRGFPDLGGETLVSVDVDHHGRLLVVTSGQRVLRWPAGGPVDLEVQVDGCAANARVAVGRSTVDDSFATACAPPQAAIVVQRRDAAGAVIWTSTAPAVAPEGPMSAVHRVLLDEDGQVWLAGKGTHPVNPNPTTSYLQVFTASSRSAAIAWRVAYASSFREYEAAGYTQLREAPGDQIAFIEAISCCQHPAGGGTSPSSGVRAQIVAPAAVQAPTCSIQGAALTGLTRTSAHLHFTGCTPYYSDVVGRPTGYRVEVRSGDLAPAITEHPDARELPPVDLDLSLQPGVLTEVLIEPVNEAGDGTPASVTRLTTVAPFPTTAAFVDRQIQDLLRDPDEVPRDAVVAAVADGSEPPVEVVDDWLSDPFGRARTEVEPVARLYEAFFLRPADSGGLDYWVRRRASGTQLAVAANTFAASSEFENRYGSLSNQAFVAKLYANVFGRPADPSGLAYWTRQLDLRRITRGRFVTQFSESSESRRRTASYVEPIAAKFLLRGATTTAAERTTWAAAPDPQRAAIEAVLASAAYEARVSARIDG